MSYFKLLFEGEVYALARAAKGMVERWRPQAQEWIRAAWNAEQIYGERAFEESEVIAEEEAEAVKVSGELRSDLTDNDRAILRGSR